MTNFLHTYGLPGIYSMICIHLHISSKIPKTAVGFAVLRMQMARRSPVDLLRMTSSGSLVPSASGERLGSFLPMRHRCLWSVLAWRVQLTGDPAVIKGGNGKSISCDCPKQILGRF